MQKACCAECFNIGCFYGCDTIDTGLTADENGVHTLLYDLGGVTHTEEFTGVIGVEITIPNIFREIGISKFQILKPSFDLFEHTDGGNTYNIFCLSNSIEIAR